jgi:hypothetical protein
VILRALSNVDPMMWLTGGVAVDFLVGRWTRPHKDLDLVAFTPDRQRLEVDLDRSGFVLAHDGAWTTRWTVADPAGGIEIVFVEPAEPRTGVLVIPDGDAHGGRPGRHPLPPDYLDPDRKAELDGVRFRVCSPEGEWLARRGSGQQESVVGCEDEVMEVGDEVLELGDKVLGFGDKVLGFGD